MTITCQQCGVAIDVGNVHPTAAGAAWKTFGEAHQCPGPTAKTRSVDELWMREQLRRREQYIRQMRARGRTVAAPPPTLEDLRHRRAKSQRERTPEWRALKARREWADLRRRRSEHVPTLEDLRRRRDDRAPTLDELRRRRAA